MPSMSRLAICLALAALFSASLPGAAVSFAQAPTTPASASTALPTPAATPTPVPGSVAHDTTLLPSTLQDWIAVLNDLSTIAAIIVGGTAGYILFYARRQHKPRAQLAHQIKHWSLPEHRVLLHLDVTLANPGQLPLRPVYMEGRVQKVLPLSHPFAERLASNAVRQGTLKPTHALVQDGQTQVEWFLLERLSQEWNPGRFVIEPGESEIQSFDFVLPGDLQTVRVYTFVRNDEPRSLLNLRQEDDKGLVWELATLYDIVPGSRPAEQAANNSPPIP